MDKTSKLGLNLPEKGFRDWDVPINENFSLIDSKVAVLGLNNVFTETNSFKKPVYLSQDQNDKLILKDTRVDASSATGSNTFNSIIFQDNTGFNYANIAVGDEPEGAKRIRMFLQNKLADGSTKNAEIRIRITKDGTVSTYAPIPAENSNDTNIAVTSWVRKLFAKLDLNNVFTADQKLAKTVPVFVLDATGGTYGEIQTRKAGVRTGGFRNIEDNGVNQTILYVASADGTTVKGALGIHFDGTNAYTAAPTPAVSDSSTKIATTAYINNKFQKVDALPANADPNVWYFIKE